MAGRKHLWIDVEPVVAHHHDSRHLLAHRCATSAGPASAVSQMSASSPTLMAGVAGEHRSAARLRHVADQDARPAGLLVRLRRQPLHQCDQVGMAPVAVARQPHHLPVAAIDRQTFGAGDAALGIEADHPCRHRRRQHLAARTTPWRDFWIVGIGERAAAVLWSTVPLSCASAAEAPTTAGIRRRIKSWRGFMTGET